MPFVEKEAVPCVDGRNALSRFSFACPASTALEGSSRFGCIKPGLCDMSLCLPHPGPVELDLLADIGYFEWSPLSAFIHAGPIAGLRRVVQERNVNFDQLGT